MKLYSWNVNGIRAVEKKGALGDFLCEKNPDIVCFQETKIQADQVLAEKFDEKYPEYSKFWSFAERKGYSGTAIWSKVEPKFVAKNFPREILEKYNLSDNFGDATSEGRICAALFDNFWLITVYTPNAKNGLERLDLREKWDAAFLEFAKFLENCKAPVESDWREGESLDNSEKCLEEFNPKTNDYQLEIPVLFCGDLNVAHEEIDLARPKQNRNTHGFTDQERAGFSNFVKNGFSDTLRLAFPNKEELYTWWSYYGKSRERNVGWRIDYFLTNSPEITENPQIHPQTFGSDHCPVSVEVFRGERNV